MFDKNLLIIIRRALALTCALLISSGTQAEADIEVDESAYFTAHGQFHFDPLGPRIEGSAEFIKTRNDIAIEIYAGSDIASAEVLGKQIIKWFKAVEQPAFPVNIQVRSITSHLAKETIISTFMIDGTFGWQSPGEYKAIIAKAYARARDGLDPRFHHMADQGRIWTKVWP